MDSISIRYGENLTLPIETGDTESVSADFFIGKPGELYVLAKHISLTNGNGIFEFSSHDTELPLGVYYYQINTTDGSGRVKKFPSPESYCDGCDNDFPQFIINEALDKTEIS